MSPTQVTPKYSISQCDADEQVYYDGMPAKDV